jgi:hypothetical protein
MANKTYIINNRKFRLVKEVELGFFLELSEMMADIQRAPESAEATGKFVRDAKRFIDLLCLVLEPVGKVSENYNKWEDLKHTTMPQLSKIITSFFGPGGPLKFN